VGGGLPKPKVSCCSESREGRKIRGGAKSQKVVAGKMS
jgi:hypothetical protein